MLRSAVQKPFLHQRPGWPVVLVMRQKFDALFRQGFVRSVGVLVGGTAFAQALMVLVLPLLTRLYTPEDFSVLAVYASILGIISVAACLRLEIAIPLPQRDEDAVNLLALALCSSAAVAGLSALIVALFSAQIVALVAQPKLLPYLWLLPLGIWFSSSYAALQFWATRKKRFSIIAKTRMTQAVGGASAQVGLGWWSGFGAFGLLLGQMISSGAGLFGLGRAALREDRAVLRRVSFTGMRSALRDYDRFPKYSTFEAFANTAGTQLPVIIIAAIAAGPEAGYLLMATRAMAVPMGLIGGAVSQVYLSRAPTEMRTGHLAEFTAQIINGLIKSGVGPLIFVGMIAPVAFPLIFGSDWARAGEVIAWMTPWFVMQFLASPISMALHVTQAQRLALILPVVGFLIRVAGVLIVASIDRGWVIQAYAISSFLYYFLYYCVVIVHLQVKRFDLMRGAANNLFIIIGWISSAGFIRLAA